MRATMRYGFQFMISVARVIIVTHVHTLRWRISSEERTHMKTYKWESLTWNEVKPNVFRTRIDLLPMQKLHVEEGWEISGPIRVSFRWDKAKRHTRVWYKPLPKKLLDLDDPTAYPCKICKAKRGKPCVGDDARCTFQIGRAHV